MSKKWYKVTFYARMSQDDVHAMNKYFYDTMSETMEIGDCSDLEMVEDEPLDYEAPHYDSALFNGEFDLDMRTGDLEIQNEYCTRDYAVGDEVNFRFVDEDDIINKYRVKEVTDESVIFEFIENVAD